MTDIALRQPDTVMRLARLGSFHQSRLSFMRVLTRRLARDGWRFEQTAFEIDEVGVGHAVYTAHGPQRSYSLVAFAHDLPAESRSDRVIAEAWDTTHALFDGVPNAADIARLAENIPLQEAGRVRGSELSVSRANRSVRLWDHIVAHLSAGQQPDPAQIDAVGYLMRTTAVYGSGKLGAADREMIADRPEFHSPFQVEMLSVYLTRWFVRDLVQHMADSAAHKAGRKAARLDPALAQALGLGNSTGLGMAPFLLNHPLLFNNWITAREEALRRVRSLQTASPADLALFSSLMRRSQRMIDAWTSDHPVQVQKLRQLKADIAALDHHLSDQPLSETAPWDQLFCWAEANLTAEGQEWVASLVLEPYGHLVDDLIQKMAADTSAGFRIAGAMRVGALRDLVADIYGWALQIDWTQPANKARAWYVSEEKLEPRLGERFEEPIEAYEQPLAPGRDAAALYHALADWPDDTQIAEFLLRHPEHRHTIRRVQIIQRAPYGEIRDNTISKTLLPIDMLRCKLAFFGATQFDPRSDRWVRIRMFGHAPYPDELTCENADFWVYPDEAEAV